MKQMLNNINIAHWLKTHAWAWKIQEHELFPHPVNIKLNTNKKCAY